MTEPEEFPFPLGPRGAVIGEHYHRRYREDPLGEVRLPSGCVARLAVGYEDSAQVMNDLRFTRNLNYPGAPTMYPGVNIILDPDVVSNMDPPRHTRIRRLLSGSFTPRKVAEWRPKVRAMINRLYDRLDGDEFDYVNDLAFPYAIEVICEVMGVPDLDSKQIRVWADDLLPSANGPMEQQMGSLIGMATYLGEVITTLRENPSEENSHGLIGTLLQAHDEEGRLTESELVRNVMGFILAGHETTASVLSRGMLRLLGPEGGYQQLVARPELIPTAVDELLRTEVPGDGAPLRVATEDVELPSGIIRKGEAVVASFVGANHDPAVFEAPEELRLDREGAQHLTFGRGTHYCVGANLAKMELEEMLSVTTERYPNLTYAEPPDEVPWTDDTAIKRPKRLLLRRH